MVSPAVAQGLRQDITGTQPMTQARGARQRLLQQPPINARCGCEDTRLLRLHDLPQFGRLLRVGDDCAGADRPRVHQSCSQCIGPIQGTGVHHDILRCQLIPTLPHHPARPYSAMGMQNSAGLAGCAGGENDIARTIGIAQDRAGRGKRLKRTHLLGLQRLPVKFLQSKLWITNHGFGMGFSEQLHHLAVCQSDRTGHGNSIQRR